MTYTIVGRCERTGMLGIATATNSLSVGARVPFVMSGLGAVAIMSRADQRLGSMALNLLQTGYKAPGVIDQLVRGDPFAEYRQLGIVDDDGHTAARTGQMNNGWCGHVTGQNYVSLGNGLVGEQVVRAMETAFVENAEHVLEERLMICLEAGKAAGGQPQGQRSAALLVYERKTFARVNLRVDVDHDPEGELRRVFDAYQPTIPYYSMRQVDPRVPGLDEWLAMQHRV